MTRCRYCGNPLQLYQAGDLLNEDLWVFCKKQNGEFLLDNESFHCLDKRHVNLPHEPMTKNDYIKAYTECKK